MYRTESQLIYFWCLFFKLAIHYYILNWDLFEKKKNKHTKDIKINVMSHFVFFYSAHSSEWMNEYIIRNLNVKHGLSQRRHRLIFTFDPTALTVSTSSIDLATSWNSIHRPLLYRLPSKYLQFQSYDCDGSRQEWSWSRYWLIGGKVS